MNPGFQFKHGFFFFFFPFHTWKAGRGKEKGTNHKYGHLEYEQRMLLLGDCMTHFNKGKISEILG
jgi:hypothetical protein